MEALNKKVEVIKIIVAVVMVVFGCVLLMMGFWVSPVGIIDSSVLVGFGETLTFSGAVLGINYLYQAKHKELEYRIEAKMADKKKD